MAALYENKHLHLKNAKCSEGTFAVKLARFS